MSEWRTIFDLLRDPEIRYLDTTLVVNKDIRAFDIAMNDVPFVQIVQTGEDLSNEVSDKRFLESAVIA